VDGADPVDYSLYVITSADYAGRTHEEVAAAALAGGATILQLRDKRMSAAALYQVACRLRELTRRAGVPLIVNDRVDVAVAADADGVHLGPDDLPLAAARKVLGPRRIIGASVDSVAEAIRAEREGADYLGVGPVFATATKPDAGTAVGVQTVAAIVRAVGIPVVGIGGITAATAAEVVRAGAAGVAVISAVAAAVDMTSAARAVLEAVRAGRRGRAAV
jgi:thiamine-phosphate pyrophosphorylase